MKIIKKTFKIIFLTAFVTFMVVWIGTLLKCDILTAFHGHEFKDTYKQTNMLVKTEHLKVLKYSQDYAEVYCIDKNKSSGDVLHCRKIGEEWDLISWNTIWSDMGSASDVIFPYWWHFIYGGL